jgi:hypothetical protein
MTVCAQVTAASVHHWLGDYTRISMHVLNQIEALRADVVGARVNAGLPHAGTSRTVVDERSHSSGRRAGSGEPEDVVAQALIEEENGALNNMFGCICAKRFCQCSPEEQADLAIWVRVC